MRIWGLIRSLWLHPFRAVECSTLNDKLCYELCKLNPGGQANEAH